MPMSNGKKATQFGGSVLFGEFNPKRSCYCKERDNAMKGKRIMIRR